MKYISHSYFRIIKFFNFTRLNLNKAFTIGTCWKLKLNDGLKFLVDERFKLEK